MTVEPRALRRKIRRAFHVRSWPWRTKLAVGAWIPAIILALALFTGPNRPSSAADTTATTSTTLPQKLRPVQYETPSTIPLEDVIGSWLKGVKGSRLPTYKRIAKQHKPPRVLTKHPGTGVLGKKHK